MSELRTIRLYGKLGATYGRIHKLAVDSTAEAVRALCVLLPGFERELMTSRERGIHYACFLGKANIGPDQLRLTGGSEDIRIAPALMGAKTAGLAQFITGAVLVVVGFAVSTFDPVIGAYIIKMGVVMMIGGVIQMLSPQQNKIGTKANNEASYNFNGPVNTTAQGNPVPLLYGRMIVGSAVISAGILAQDQAYIGAPLAGPAISRVNPPGYPDLV